MDFEKYMFDAISVLDDDDRLEVYDSLFGYVFGKEIYPETINDNAYAVYILLKNIIDKKGK